MINFRIPSLFFLLTLPLCYYSQYNGFGFLYPLDRSSVITGNYGEIRPNHFHAGLDFSTDAVANLPIKSVSEGYVSRIKISSVGYGKVIYITHPNGYVSVYAHQKRYASKIDDYVKQKQLSSKKNELELFLTPDELPIQKGEVIGYTGNSGNSSGPHLHFEIREEKSEIPINPLLVYDIEDHIKPELTHIAFYNTSDTNHMTHQLTVPVKNINHQLSLPKYTQVLSENTFAIGFSGFDRADATINKNNIYEAKILLDNQLIYHHQLNNISFDNGRYVNVFSEKENGIIFQKCFSPSCYNISIYKTLVNGGKIILNDTLTHKISLQINDEKGNKNVLTFFVKTKNLKGYHANTINNNVFCNKDFRLKEDNFDLFIPQGSLANPVYIHKCVYIKAPAGGDVELGDENTKVIKAFKMGLKIANPLKNKESRLVMTVNGDVIGGQYNDGWLYADSKSFGSFNYKYDTVAPTITLPSSKKKSSKNVVPKNSIHFKIADNLSGIGEYHVYVNEVWQIAEYDAKSNTVTCDFKETTPKKLRIEVIDKVGNKTILNREL